MRRRCRRLLVCIGRRGATLLFLALVDLVFAYALLKIGPRDVEASPSFRFAASVAPLPLWAALWAGVGVVCTVQAFQRVDRFAFAAASLIKVAWCLVQALGWLLGEIPRGYLGSVVWLGFAGFIQVIAGWRENEDR